MTAPYTRETRAVRAGIESDTQHGAVVPPIVLSSTFAFAGLGQPRRYDYSRSGNPTRDLLGEALADLEGGAAGIITATGMAAVTLVLALVRPGERIVAPHDCYGGTWRLLDACARTGRAEVAFVDQADPTALARELARRPRLVWLETPSNPLLRLVDIAAIAAQAHAAGALVAADNTFLTPLWQRPLALGADLVVHSTTKYVNGHSDLVGGAVVAREAALGDELAWWANCLGLTGGAFDAWLALRGLRTLHVRLRQHQDNAAALAVLLSAHPAVARVHYPGLPAHPDHALATRQQQGFGAMLSFELAGGLPAVRRFLDGLRFFSLAESLGSVESLIAHPESMTHAAMSPAARAAAGITAGLLRLSAGIEATADLLADVSAGLERAAAA
ncbi:MAG: cystathionine gamma-synthase [Gammaproteobacteria bacterium]|nr:cystathionine gamma-synthase [Gammaproteobacteria bacterium]